MTDYTKHIEKIEFLLRVIGPTEALDAAITLMQAATPLSSEEERKHIARAICIARHDTDGSFTALSTAAVEALVLRERAAARAEGAAELSACKAEVRKLQELYDDAIDDLGSTGAELAACNADIERLREENEKLTTWGPLRRLNDEWTAVEAALQIKLTERDAENERLRAENEVHVVFIDSYESRTTELETKLTNLRAAAERVIEDRSVACASFLDLRDAIEASK